MRDQKGSSIISLPEEYIVIDTETTGLDYDFCQIIEVSALKCSGGVVTDQFSSLVRPRVRYSYKPGETNKYIDEFIVNLTGITNEMLDNAPTADTVIPQFLEFIGDAILIGHNVNFDVNFLYDASVENTGMPLRNDFIDTLRIARKVFPGMAHHRLVDMAEACCVNQANAHRALDDCYTTFQCYEAMRKKILQIQSEDEFRRNFKYGKILRYKERLNNITATEEIDETNPLFGKVVVFTGTLSSMTRHDAFQLVANYGGIPETNLTMKSNFLVIGRGDFAKSVKSGKTNKMKKAEDFQKKGCEIAILSEDAFFDLMQNN